MEFSCSIKCLDLHKQWKPSQIRKDSEFFGQSFMVKLHQNDGSINATHFFKISV